MEKFSILIANYNNGHFFQDCYNSIITQTYQNFEVIILDDHSTDNSIEIINSIIGEDSRFKLYQNEENKKVGYTKRKLIELSTSEVCGFLDPDDALEPTALYKILNTYEKYPKIGMVYSNFIFTDENLLPVSIHKGKQIDSINSVEYFNFNGEISHFATFKKSYYKKTLGIDPYLKIAEDKDWYMKMCEVAHVKYIDEDLYLYRIHKGGISTNNNSDKAYFWHWVAIIKAAERRNINVEELFLENLVRKDVYETEVIKNNHLKTLLKKSRWLKIGAKLGFFKLYKYL